MASDIIFDTRRLGDGVRGVRAVLGISLRDVGEAAGVSASQVLRIESGEYDCNVSTLVSLCGALGIRYGALIEYCATIDMSLYAKAAQEEQARPNFLIYKSSDQKREKAFVDLVAGSAVVLAYLVRAENPLRKVAGFEFPLDSQKAAFVRYAEQHVKENAPVEERYGSLSELRTSPARLLLAKKLITKPIVEDYFARYSRLLRSDPDNAMWIPMPHLRVEELRIPVLI
ncbi:MAG TPA: helix-turn-helix transcriptional regulator [Candidatus Acidoferrum sp.]|nr:helix-turn-helix transcriptional regulator [Candidatus Acidoferrum sp.]